MSASVIVWAPQGSGLGEVAAQKLRSHFGLRRELEVFGTEHKRLPTVDHLVIARCEQPPRYPLRVVAFANAMQQMEGSKK